MSQDIVADGLNQIMNAKRARHTSVQLKRHSKLLIAVLAIGKLKSYIKDYRVEGRNLTVELGEKLNYCIAIKPRLLVQNRELMKYIKRYLPARDMGIVIISTNKGLMTHHTALEKKQGGSLIAYFY